ncbi:MAG: hypothetical protein GY700_12970, partial [Propionibacteriaceae bacterium]|nr:hypothetical protein [Propionibacteriaceae bacterium]
NLTGDDQLVLSWLTPMEGLYSECLEVSKDGNQIEFDGLMVKRGDPPPAAYKIVPAGQAVTNQFKLNEAYSINAIGNYAVKLKSPIPDHVRKVDAPNLGAHAVSAKSQPRVHNLPGVSATISIVAGKKKKAPKQTRGEAARQLQATAAFSDTADDADAYAVPKAPTLVGGTDAQQTAVKTAHTNAYSYVVSSSGKLTGTSPLYIEWFGAFDDGRFRTVKGNYSSLQTAMTGTTFTYNLTGAGCQANWYAYTHKGGTTVWFCGAFWNAPATGTDSQAGTIVHELSHAVCRTDDNAYGQANCRALAR